MTMRCGMRVPFGVHAFACAGSEHPKGWTPNGAPSSIRFEPEELLRAGDSGRGLQIKTGVGPAQHQLIVHANLAPRRLQFGQAAKMF